MSTYVDDLTFSGTLANRLLEKNVTQIVVSAGLEIHPQKTNFYPRNASKLITGVIVNGSGVSVRNKHHKAIYTLFGELDQVSDDESLKKIQQELIGRLQAAGQIDPRFKQRAKSLNESLADRL